MAPELEIWISEESAEEKKPKQIYPDNLISTLPSGIHSQSSITGLSGILLCALSHTSFSLIEHIL